MKASRLDPPRLTLEAAAKRLGVHYSSVRRWIIGGLRGRKLPAIWVGAQRYVLAADLEEFILACEGSLEQKSEVESMLADTRPEEYSRPVDIVSSADLAMSDFVVTARDAAEVRRLVAARDACPRFVTVDEYQKLKDQLNESNAKLAAANGKLDRARALIYSLLKEEESSNEMRTIVDLVIG